jgi:hypothetical protein
MRRRIGQVIVALLVLYFFALAGFAFAMRQPPERFARIMAHVGPAPFLLFPFETMWKDARRGVLHPGDPAPDFTLPLVDHSANVQLASLRGVRPVVLVFGSYT